MIYTRFENSITIIGQCGKHKLPEFKVPVLLARIQRNEDKAIRHQFIEFLKADGGYVEIIDAYNTAPVLELKGDELKKAIQEAM